MIKLVNGGVYYMNGAIVKENVAFMVEAKKRLAEKGTITYGILSAHDRGDGQNLKIRIARHNVRKHNSGGKSVVNERVFSALHAHELP